LKILLASSEVHPYSKTGGLADMVGALGKALARAGHQVGLVSPLYAGVRERCPGLRREELTLDIPLGVKRVPGEIWTADPAEGLKLYFVDQPGFFQRSGLYQKDGMDFPDNAERFLFFSKAVAELAFRLAWQPQIVHTHDWQTGPAALFVRHRQQEGGRPLRICNTVHNLAYQGLFPASQYALTNLPWDYFKPDGVEFYGQLSCLKAGLNYSDLVTTVSPRYAREITTEEFGCGLDGLLRYRNSHLVGILNGVDYSEWRTTGNPHLPFEYSADDLRGKTLNKLALQRELGLPERPEAPLFGNIGRLVEQKGVEIMLGALEEMLHADLQFVVLGTGAPEYQRAYQDLARRFPRQAAARIEFDEGLSHRIEAGCDFFVMPSRFEPCGLNQMYSLRYGTIPIVRAVGGLDDTVVDIREDPDRMNGIKFHEYSAPALAKAIRKALALYAEAPLFERYRANAMRVDFSWDRTAAEYGQVYRRLVDGSPK
jgi:starch synthase